MITQAARPVRTPPAWKKPLLWLFAGCLLLLLLLSILPLLFRRTPENPQPLWSVAFSPDGKTLVTGGGPDEPNTRPQLGEIVLWDASSGKKRRIISQPWGVRRALVSPDGKLIVAGDFGGTTRLLEASTGRLKATLTPHSSQVNAIAISRDGQRIVGGSYDGTISLWDPAGKELATLLTPNEKIEELALSPAGYELVAGCRAGKAYLFDLDQRTPPKVLQAYVGPRSYWTGVEAVTFAPDGKSFLTGGMTVRLWETGTGSLMRDLEPLNARVNSMAFSPDGSRVAGVDRDGWLALWDLSTGSRTNSVRAHDNGMSFSLAFSPDGRRLATVARRDWAVKLWDSQTLELRATFQRTKPHR